MTTTTIRMTRYSDQVIIEIGTAKYDGAGELLSYVCQEPREQNLSAAREAVRDLMREAIEADPTLAPLSLPRRGRYTVVWYYYTDASGRDFAAGSGTHSWAQVSTHETRDAAIAEAAGLIARREYSDIAVRLDRRDVMQFTYQHPAGVLTGAAQAAPAPAGD